MNTATKLMQIAVLVGGTLWLPMCGSDNDDNGTPSRPSPTYGATSSTGGSRNAGGPAATGGQPGASTGGSPAAAPTITIQNFAFSPNTLTVAPGDTVTVMNMDSAPHSVTSESAANSFQLGAVNGVQFDTGILNAGASGSFTIPASAPTGTAVPFFCKVHLSSMPQGTLTID
jgi:plastocyanin